MEPLIFFILLLLLIGLSFDCAPENDPDQRRRSCDAVDRADRIGQLIKRSAPVCAKAAALIFSLAAVSGWPAVTTDRLDRCGIGDDHHSFFPTQQ